MLSKKYDSVKWLNFSRNYWKELALSAWLEYSTWDAVITLDADWQHPPQEIANFLQEWESGYQIVYNKRPEIKDAWWIKVASSKLFYTLFNLISDFKLEPWTTDFRLMDRVVVNVFNQFREKNRIFRGLIDLIWFNRKALIFDARANVEWRRPSYNYSKLFSLALDSITSFSLFPLKLVWMIWVFIASFSFAIMLIGLIDKFFWDHLDFSNIAFIALSNTFLMWIVLMSLWLMALYVANIHDEVQGRPLYIVQNRVWFDT
jgi:dolichol-phosphate mannosyltransferase